MFIKIEGERLVNLDEVEIVELRHSNRTVNVYSGGVLTVPDSHILYRYYSKLELEPEPSEEKV